MTHGGDGRNQEPDALAQAALPLALALLCGIVAALATKATGDAFDVLAVVATVIAVPVALVAVAIGRRAVAAQIDRVPSEPFADAGALRAGVEDTAPSSMPRSAYPDLVTPREASELLDVSVSVIREWIARNEIRYHVVESGARRMYRIPREELALLFVSDILGPAPLPRDLAKPPDSPREPVAEEGSSARADRARLPPFRVPASDLRSNRLVVVDPRILVAGLLGQTDGRRLVGLLSYGQLASLPEQLAREGAALDKLARAGGHRGGPSTESMVEMALERRHAVEAVIPRGLPSQLLLVSSEFILDQVEEKIDAAMELTLLPQPDRGGARRLVAAITGFWTGSAPSGDEFRDRLLALAAAADAVLVTQDESLAPDEGAWRVGFHDQAATVVTSRLSTYLNEVARAADLRPEDVPLDLMVRVLGATAQFAS